MTGVIHLVYEFGNNIANEENNIAEIANNISQFETDTILFKKSYVTINLAT